MGGLLRFFSAGELTHLRHGSAPFPRGSHGKKGGELPASLLQFDRGNPRHRQPTAARPSPYLPCPVPRGAAGRTHPPAARPLPRRGCPASLFWPQGGGEEAARHPRSPGGLRRHIERPHGAAGEGSRCGRFPVPHARAGGGEAPSRSDAHLRG